MLETQIIKKKLGEINFEASNESLPVFNKIIISK